MRDYSDRYQKLLKKLEEARKKAGLKQTEVAEKLKKPQSYVSKIERRERRIDVVELKQLLKIYKKQRKQNYFLHQTANTSIFFQVGDHLK